MIEDDILEVNNLLAKKRTYSSNLCTSIRKTKLYNIES